MKKRKKDRFPVKNKDKQSVKSGYLSDRLAGLFLIAVAFLLYSGTFQHKYALDDFATISGNRLVKGGVKSVPELFSTSYYHGMNGLAEPFYRPLSLVMFAIEWQLMPDSPALGHIINVLLYALTAFLLFFFLKSILSGYNPFIPFCIALLWVSHPLHAEVVANIKSRDEILMFMFSILTLYLSLKSLGSGKFRLLAMMSLSFFLALLSKEVALTLVIILPLTLYFFTDSNTKEILRVTAPILVCAIIFLIVRGVVLDENVVYSGISFRDNSVAGSRNFSERIGTPLYIMGYYIFKFMFPLSFSSDYSYNQIPLVGLDNLFVLLSLGLYLALAFILIRGFRSRSVFSYAVFFFLASMAITSNIFILIGATMAERFMYMPSLGLCIFFVAGLTRLLKVDFDRDISYLSAARESLLRKGFGVVILAVTAFFSLQTVLRAADWKDNFSLFSADILSADNSVKMKYYYAGAAFEESKKPDMDVQERQQLISSALEELEKGKQIDPASYMIFERFGEIYNGIGKYPEAVLNYKRSIECNADNVITYNNVGNTYFRMRQFDSAIAYLKISTIKNPNSSNYLNNLASAYFSNQQYEEAVNCYNRSIALNPDYVEAYRNLGTTYFKMNDNDLAISTYKKGLTIDPGNALLNYYLGKVYRSKGDLVNADAYERKALSLDPSLK